MGPKEWAAFPKRDPRAFVFELLALQARGVRAGWDQDEEKRKLLLLRRGMHKPVRELRDAAVFCVLMGRALALDLKVIRVERENGDADAVAYWEATASGERVEHYCPLQMKELVPFYLNPFASLEGVLKKFRKYSNASDTIGVVFLNRRFRLDPPSIVVPQGLTLAGLWVFGGMSRDAKRWLLAGDLMRPSDEWRAFEMDHPLSPFP